MDSQNNYYISNTSKGSRFESFKKNNLLKSISVIGILVSVLATIMVAQNIYNPLSLFTRAVAGNATIEVLPGTSILPPDKAYSLWVTTDQKTSFIRVVVNFDRNKLMVTQEPELTLAGFNKIIWPSMTEANQSGSMIFVAGLDTSQVNNAPTGGMRLASINFNAKPTTSNSTSNVTIYNQDSQVVNIDTSLMTITGKTTNITIVGNSNPSPTATTTASPTATANATANPTSSSTPTSNPTSSAEPTGYPAWDVDQNGHTNIVDIGLVIDNYDRRDFANPRVDVNKNGVADIIDIGIIIDHYE